MRFPLLPCGPALRAARSLMCVSRASLPRILSLSWQTGKIRTSLTCLNKSDLCGHSRLYWLNARLIGMSEEERKTVVCRGLFGEEVEVPLADLRFRPGAYGILFRDDSV